MMVRSVFVAALAVGLSSVHAQTADEPEYRMP